MKRVVKIYESQKVLVFLSKRGLKKQYIKSCSYIKQGFFGKIDFKIKQPKHEQIWSFRINRQFRAYGYFHEEDFIVYHIDNHQ